MNKFDNFDKIFTYSENGWEHSTMDSFKNYKDIEDRVIGGITFRGRTYKYIGYEWIQYIAQLDDNRALSIGLRNMDCVPGTMPDIILNNMTFK